MELVSNRRLKYINGQFYTDFSFCQCFPSASEHFSLSLCKTKRNQISSALPLPGQASPISEEGSSFLILSSEWFSITFPFWHCPLEEQRSEFHSFVQWLYQTFISAWKYTDAYQKLGERNSVLTEEPIVGSQGGVQLTELWIFNSYASSLRFLSI